MAFADGIVRSGMITGSSFRNHRDASGKLIEDHAILTYEYHNGGGDFYEVTRAIVDRVVSAVGDANGVNIMTVENDDYKYDTVDIKLTGQAFRNYEAMEERLVNGPAEAATAPAR